MTKKKKQKINWLCRSLIIGPYYTLCLSEKEYHAALDYIDMRKEERDLFVTTGSNATVHALRHSDNGLCCIVCLDDKRSKKCSYQEIIAVLVHEAVHVWQRFATSIGEYEPSKEFEAYAIQMISQELITDYTKRTKYRRKRRK